MILWDTVRKILMGEERDRWDPEEDGTVQYLRQQQESAERQVRILRREYPSYERLYGVDRHTQVRQ